MVTRNLLRFFVLSIISTTIFSCKTEEILLHGDIKGLVTDDETSEPIQKALVKLNPSSDTTRTAYSRTYYVNNIIPGEYEIQASKNRYSFFFQAEDGIRDSSGLEFRRVLFR